MIRLIQDSLRYRELIELLTAREIKIRYKQSALGILWALFQPAIMVVLFTAIFTKIVRMPTNSIPYPLFILTGMISWNFFSAALTNAIPSIVNNAELVKKIYFPRLIFPLVSIAASIFDFLITVILLVILMFYYQTPLSLWIAFLPAIFLVQLILTVGISLLLASLNVFYRDVKNALGSLIQIWMFASPVIYPLDVVRPHLRKILLFNPMSGIIEAYRRILLEGRAPNWDSLLIATVIAVFIFIIAHKTFKCLEPNFADAV